MFVKIMINNKDKTVLIYNLSVGKNWIQFFNN